jgi:hypothetical protein
MGRSAAFRPTPPSFRSAARARRPSLCFPARGALPRRRVSRRLRRGPTRGSSNSMVSPFLAHTPERPGFSSPHTGHKVGRRGHDARFSVGMRVQPRGAQPRCWGAHGQAATACACISRRKVGSARRPARKHTCLGAHHTTPRSGNTGEVHRRASATGCWNEVVPSAGVHTATTLHSPALAAQDHYGTKAGSQESAARRTTLDVTARHQR